jgi:Zn-dependent protease
VFNLLPLPPLDGSRLLPRVLDRYVVKVAPYSFVILLVIINFQVLRENLLLRPVIFTASILQWLFNTRFWGIA